MMVGVMRRDVAADLAAFDRDGYVVLEHAVDVGALDRIPG